MNKNFLRGIGSLINLLSNPNHRKADLALPSHSDEEAIYKDWNTVGNDLYNAAKMKNPAKYKK